MDTLGCIGALLPAAPVRLLDATLSVADIVAITGSSRWTVRRLLRQWQRDGYPLVVVAPRPCGGIELRARAVEVRHWLGLAP